MKHLEAISAADPSPSPCRARGDNGGGGVQGPAASDRPPQVAGGGCNAKGKGKGHEAAARPNCSAGRSRGRGFEEDGVGWKALAVVWDADEEGVVVWYYDVEMAADGDLSEDEMDLARTEGLNLGPLECSSLTEVKGWIRAARSGR